MKIKYLLPSFVCVLSAAFSFFSANVAVAQNCAGGCFGYPSGGGVQGSAGAVVFAPNFQPTYYAPTQYQPAVIPMPSVDLGYSVPSATYFPAQPVTSSSYPTADVIGGLYSSDAYIANPVIQAPYAATTTGLIATAPMTGETVAAIGSTKVAAGSLKAEEKYPESVQGSLSDKVESDQTEPTAAMQNDQVESLQRQLDDANRQLAAVKDRSKKVSEKLVAAKAEVRAAQDRIAATEQSSKATQERSKAELEKVKQNLQKKLTRYEDQQQDFKKRLAEAEEKLEIAEQKVKAAEQKLATQMKASDSFEAKKKQQKKTAELAEEVVESTQEKIDKLKLSLERQLKKARDESDRNLRSKLADLAEDGIAADSRQAKAATKKATKQLSQRLEGINRRVERRIEQLKNPKVEK
jgi:hypothetical protein